MTTEPTPNTEVPTPVTDVPTEKKVIVITDAEKAPKKSIIKMIIPVAVIILILSWAAYVYKSDQPTVTKTVVEHQIVVTPDLGKIPDLGIISKPSTKPDLQTLPVKETQVQSLPVHDRCGDITRSAGTQFLSTAPGYPV